MLDCLRGGDQGGIEHDLVVDLAGDLLRLVEDAFDRRALGALGLFLQRLESAIEPLDLALGLAKVHLEALLELGIRRLLDHVGQRLLDLVLGVVDVLQRMQKQVFHRRDIG